MSIGERAVENKKGSKAVGKESAVTPLYRKKHDFAEQKNAGREKSNTRTGQNMEKNGNLNAVCALFPCIGY